MKNFMNKKTLLLLAAFTAVLTMGAGCATKPETADNNVTLPYDGAAGPADPVSEAMPDNISTTPSVTTTSDPSTEPRVLNAAQTDASWETYTSPSLGFTMMTPLKGKYAPTWEIKHFNLDDSHVVNGCYYRSDNMIIEGGDFGQTQDGVKFCHTSSVDNGMGQHYFIDDYATMIGTKVVVIEFTKHTVTAANVMDCAGKMTEKYSTSGTYCIPFVESEYKATLDGIVGTFKMNATSNNL